MNHIALDLGGMKSQFCIRDRTGKTLREGILPTHSLPDMLESEPPSRIILETCAEAFPLADRAIKLGHDVRVVPSTLARMLGVGAHGVKTDRRDAQALSEASTQVELRSVHIRSIVARDRNSLVAGRVALVHSRTLLINNVRGWARTCLIKIPRGAISTFPQRVEDAALSTEYGLPTYIARALRVITQTSAELKEADAELRKIANQDADCRLLMTAPGVGPMTSVLFVSAVDGVERFPDASHLSSYLGLTPGERSSSKKKHRTGITKAGPARLRWCMVQACWSACTHYPKDPLVLWTGRVATRGGRMVAIVAMARKLSGILYAMLRDQRPYDATKVCSSAR